MKERLDEFFRQLDRLHAGITLTEQAINANLKGKDVIILGRGKYHGRRAQIQHFYYDENQNQKYLHILIYRADGRVGFKGREKFIDDHAHEYVRYDECELM